MNQRKKKFENEEEIEINNLKIKSEIADKLFVLFKNKYNVNKIIYTQIFSRQFEKFSKL